LSRCRKCNVKLTGWELLANLMALQGSVLYWGPAI
jgi:hypothetical protein